jgi:hypothetical protein
LFALSAILKRNAERSGMQAQGNAIFPSKQMADIGWHGYEG